LVSYTNLTCNNDTNGLDPRDQLWEKLLEEFYINSSNLYRFDDFPAFYRSVIGDEATDFLRDIN
jgi:hypothetical protein